jgi:hypothetical protein
VVFFVAVVFFLAAGLRAVVFLLVVGFFLATVFRVVVFFFAAGMAISFQRLFLGQVWLPLQYIYRSRNKAILCETKL